MCLPLLISWGSDNAVLKAKMQVDGFQFSLCRGAGYEFDPQSPSSCHGKVPHMCMLAEHLTILKGRCILALYGLHMALSLMITVPAKGGSSPRSLLPGLLSVPLYPFRKWDAILVSLSCHEQWSQTGWLGTSDIDMVAV